MNRMINDPNLVVEEAIQGYLRAYPEYYRRTEHPRVLAHPSVPIAGKVGVVSGGGSGHEPAFLGYVGKSLLDAVAIGEIFHRRPLARFWMPSEQRTAVKGLSAYMVIMPVTI